MLAAACALYLATRLLVLMTAIDHIDNIHPSEYFLANSAREFGYHLWDWFPSHIWGGKAAVFSLVPFFQLGLSETIALKFSALLLALLGFAALVYLALREAGALPAAALAALLIFPHPEYLRWSLMRYGAYPESCALLGVGLLVWVTATAKNAPRFLFAAGAGIGLIQSLSPAGVYATAAFCLATPFAMTSKRRKGTICFFAGLLAGLIPVVVSLVYRAIVGTNLVYQTAENVPGVPLLSVLQAPQWSESFKILRNILAAGDGPFSGTVHRIVLAFGLGWACWTGAAGKNGAQGWRLVLPLTFLTAWTFVALFHFRSVLELRHLLWLMPVAFVCIALAAGDWIKPKERRGAGRWLALALNLAKASLLLAFLPAGIASMSGLVQPDEMGILWRFRGGEYHKAHIGTIIGEEVRSINCLLDSELFDLSSYDFKSGLGGVFPFHLADGCRMEPYRPELNLIDDGIARVTRLKVKLEWEPEVSIEEYFSGVGCGFALKPTVGAAGLEMLSGSRFPGAQEAARVGFDSCQALRCLSP